MMTILVCVGALCTFAACVVQLVRLRRLNLLPLIHWGIIGTFFLGSVAMVREWAEVFRSLGSITPEERSVALSRGIAEAMAPFTLAIVLCVVLAVIAAVTTTIKVNLRDLDEDASS